MARRSSGEGSIYQRADGRWTAGLQVGGKRQQVYGRTRTEVVEKLRKLTEQIRGSGRLPSAGKLTLSGFMEDWITQSESRLRPGTAASYKAINRCHVLPNLGHMKLSKLQPLQLANLYSSLSKSNLSPRRVQMVHRLLHKALGDAVRWGLIASNVTEQVEAPRPDAEEPELWTLGQVTTLIRAVGEGVGGQYSAMFGFLLASGCREGEALGLLWTDIDWESKRVSIERQTTWVSNKPVQLPTKTKSGVRSLTIPEWGMALLHQQRALVAEWRLKAGAGWLGGDQVFPSNAGSAPSPSNLRRSLQALCSNLQLPAIRVHDLRHLHIVNTGLKFREITALNFPKIAGLKFPSFAIAGGS